MISSIQFIDFLKMFLLAVYLLKGRLNIKTINLILFTRKILMNTRVGAYVDFHLSMRKTVLFLFMYGFYLSVDRMSRAFFGNTSIKT
ncbi:hypothetical protein A8708_09465 [Paenibacillus oryzisoli]|uniref:Uncharacterized protein n=1 Tax=Paenibacillus oryzisoli TaxID=1850517 RepID=A0A198A436_9BACL|nr:hypothetical protein A8708_09465 [Paenibacillus oryzisoli]